jgi:hypothetical protein
MNRSSSAFLVIGLMLTTIGMTLGNSLGMWKYLPLVGGVVLCLAALLYSLKYRWAA